VAAVVSLVTMPSIPVNSVFNVNLRFEGTDMSGYQMTTLRYYNIAAMPLFTAQTAYQIGQTPNMQAICDAAAGFLLNTSTVRVYSVQAVQPFRYRIYYDGGVSGEFYKKIGTGGPLENDTSLATTQSSAVNLIKYSDKSGRAGVGHNYFPLQREGMISKDRLVQPAFSALAATINLMANILKDLPIDSSILRPCVMGKTGTATPDANLKEVRFAPTITFMDSRMRDRGA